jgi:hypothetical protein
MSSQAHVHSLEAVEAVRTALVTFLDQVEQALATLDVEMRRTLDWLEHDRPAYWRRQVRDAVDGVNEAQAALRHKLMFPINDERPSCREERAALQRAQDRLAYCQEKAESVRNWIKVVRQEMFDYQGRISQLVRLVEIDGPVAVGVLARIRHHINEYQAVRKTDGRASYESLALADKVWNLPSPSGRGAEGEGASPPLPLGKGRGEGALAQHQDEGNLSSPSGREADGEGALDRDEQALQTSPPPTPLQQEDKATGD